MPVVSLIACLLSVAVAAGLTRMVIGYALRRGLMDMPNARSSHSIPTPRGGGLAVVATTLIGVAILYGTGLLASRHAIGLVIAGAMVAIVGYVDDKRGLPPLPRFAVHIAASALVVFTLLWPATFGANEISTLTFMLICIVGCTWSINLFNFMDGIDGIAGSQAAFMSAASALLILPHHSIGIAMVLWITVGACIGFLVWNWPPAKIFMGDVGSGFLGLWLAALAMFLHAEGLQSIYTSIILNSVFVADASVTLMRRFASGKKWYEAHRSHAYQHLARRSRSHLRVTGLLWVLNISVVFPAALASERVGDSAAATIAGSVLAVFSLLAWFLGAGREDAQLDMRPAG